MVLDPGLVDWADPDLAAHTAVAGARTVPQRELEELLADHVARLGVPVRRGVEVTALEDTGDGVLVATTAGPVRTGWLVGCDGGRSTVRRLAGIAFPGTDPELTGHLAVVDIADPEKLADGWTWSARGAYRCGPQPGRVATVEFGRAPADRTEPVTLDELQAVLRRVSGTDVTLTALRGAATRWSDNARQAAAYRSGRVLLAGDAAHVHSPFGGQGLNLGVGDAMNLGWKLGAVVAGWAPEGLLDTYDAERRPLGAWVLDWTRAQSGAMRGDAASAALRQVLADLLGTRDGATHAVKQISGVTGYARPPRRGLERAGDRRCRRRGRCRYGRWRRGTGRGAGPPGRGGRLGLRHRPHRRRGRGPRSRPAPLGRRTLTLGGRAVTAVRPGPGRHAGPRPGRRRRAGRAAGRGRRRPPRG